MAEQVGTAAAVNPDAFSQLNGGKREQLAIGKSIFFNERINTSNEGLVQVLLNDGSTFTVGSGSDLVIDKFVYDPSTKQGELVATFSKGAIRFVGGKISKNPDSVTVKTPSGALAIRGGMFQAYIGEGRRIFSFLYGNELILTGSNGRTYRAFQPGYTIDASGNPGIRRTGPDDTNIFTTAFRGRGRVYALGQGGNRTSSAGNNAVGGATGRQSNGNSSTDWVSVQTLTTDATTTLINQEIQKQENKPPQQNTGNPAPGGTPPAAGGSRPIVDKPPIDGPPGEGFPPPDPGPDPEPGPVKVGGVFHGYASGFAKTETTRQTWFGTRTSSSIDKVVSLSPEDVHLILDPAGNTVSGGINVYNADLLDVSYTEYNAVFGPSSDYVSDTAFTAGASELSIVDHELRLRIWPPSLYWRENRHDVNGQSLAGSIESAAVTNTHTPLPGEAICAQCDFIKWGAWGVQANHIGDAGSLSNTRIDGWWIAGDITPVDELPVTGSASYHGAAFGNVINRGDRYSESGDLDMNWNFASRRGDLTISNFDGRTFGTGQNGLAAVPGPNHFGGVLAGSGTVGTARGSFVSNGAVPAAGVIGNWGVTGHQYQATGIFGGGKLTP
ncbi:FecR family protein [Methyloligella halotolerans]|uniref:FecR family protein n=1 Tax=Methyloligella halotolerans TaxID=1177755 RepID=UPI00083E2778|nr:FecR domain-containing protein [Methyloligella halotolerans]